VRNAIRKRLLERCLDGEACGRHRSLLAHARVLLLVVLFLLFSTLAVIVALGGNSVVSAHLPRLLRLSATAPRLAFAIHLRQRWLVLSSIIVAAVWPQHTYPSSVSLLDCPPCPPLDVGVVVVIFVLDTLPCVSAQLRAQTTMKRACFDPLRGCCSSCFCCTCTGAICTTTVPLMGLHTHR